MQPTKEQLIEILGTIVDPLTGQNLLVTNRLRQLELQGDRIMITLVYAQSLTPEQKASLNFACIHRYRELLPDYQVHLHLETQLRQGESNPGALPQIHNIVAVASGKGGVGKSTVASNLAVGLHLLGYRTGLMDADLYGPSIPTMFGMGGQKPPMIEIAGKPKMKPLDAGGMPLMSIGFIVEPEQAVVLRGPRLAGILKQFMEDCLWPELDYLIIDLPPGTGDIQLTLVQTVPLTGVVLVTTPQKVAWIDAIKAMNMFKLAAINVPILGVVENMAWFTPPDDPGKKYFIFGKGGGELLAKEAESLVLGQIPIREAIRESGDAGVPAVASEDPILSQVWMDVANRLVEAVQQRHITNDPTRIVELKS